MFVLLQDEENYNSERGISEWIRMKTLEENSKMRTCAIFV